MNCCCPASSPTSSSSSSRSVDDLGKPLLLGQTSRGEDDAEDASSSSSSSSPSSLESWCDSLLAWFVLPCLLWLDFWLVLHNNTNASTASSSHVQASQAVSMASVHLSFVMFIVASFLYRKTLEEHDCESVLLLLVPEIAMNAMLLLIFVNQTFAAYLMLLGVILALSSVVVAFSAFRLGCVHEVVVVSSTTTTERHHNQKDDGEDDDVESGGLVVLKPTSIRR